MRYIELFAGIGGFRSALDRQGHRCVFASEIDKYATRAYETLYGAGDLHGDITKIDEKDVPQHDLLVGGFPCQAFSMAGDRKGFEDTRGTLFFEIVRIAKEKRPRWLLLENVKGLLSHDGGRTFDIMCETLSGIGYAIDFDILNSKHYGVPQNRERVFIVANRDIDHEPWDASGNNIVGKTKQRVQKLGVKTFRFDFPNNKTVDKKLIEILETDVHERFYLSRERTEQLMHEFKQRQTEQKHGEIIKVMDIPRDVIKDNELQRRVYSTEGVAPTANARIDSAKILLDIETRKVGLHQIGELTDVSHTLLSRDYKGLSTYKQTGVIERHGLAIREATKRGYDIATEGDSVNFLQPNSKTRRGRVGKQVANTLETHLNQGVVIPSWIPSPQDVMRTLRVGGESTLTPKHNCDHITDGFRIRKLTPLECFRLQGFTDEQYGALKSVGISNSQIYKMAGNAVTVNVIEALVKKIDEHDERW